jgi:hypothetical protein
MTDLDIEPPPPSIPAIIAANAPTVNGSVVLDEAGLETPDLDAEESGRRTFSEAACDTVQPVVE